MRSIVAACLVLMGQALFAQTFVVDVANGPGTTWTSLVTAAAAAPDGATLLVRPGRYRGIVDIYAKGLTILADPGVEIVDGGISIQQTQPWQANVLRGLAIRDAPAQYFWGAVFLFGCAGSVVFEDLVATPVPRLPAPALPGMTAARCWQLVLRNCTIDQGCSLTDVHAVLENCSMHGRNAFWTIPGLLQPFAATAALSVGSPGGSAVFPVVQLAHCSLQGGNGDQTFANEAAIRMAGGTVVVRGASLLASGAWSTPAPAVAGAGTLRVDPGVVLQTMPVSPPPQVLPIPAVRSASAPPGGAMTAAADGPAGDLLLLVVGLPGPAAFVPGIVDPFWMDPVANVFAAIGVAAPPQPLMASVAIPNQPFVRGARLAWQAVSFGAANGLQASQPTIAIVF